MFSWGATPPPVVAPFDVNDQSFIVDGKLEHRASRLSKDLAHLETEHPIGCSTVYEILEKGKELSDNGPCLGERTGPNKEYEWISYQEVIDRSHLFGSGIIHKGHDTEKNSFVAIYSANRPEWAIADFGCQTFSLVSVPLYDTLGRQGVEHILNQCEITTLVCDTEAKLKFLLELKAKTPHLRLVITIEEVTDELKALATKHGVEVVTFIQILDLGKMNPKTPMLPKGDDIFTILYTSGTTGIPKGVIIKHRNFIYNVEACIQCFQHFFLPSKDDVILSYLPSAHIFDRSVTVMAIQAGARVAYYSRDIKLLTDDLAASKPTIFASVPRLLNRIYDAVMSEAKASYIKSTVLKWALDSKQRELESGIFRRDSLWDKILFHKVQTRLGGRVKFLISGSAPLTADVMSFLKCALGCPVVEGYGQTESGTGIAMQVIGDSSIGNVGPPLPGVHIKLVDVPEMNYSAKDNIGEICAKSIFFMSGYYKEPEKTAETLDAEGWLHTGDIGTWLPNGTLKLIDRKKNIFKLAQGEYIAPERIENTYRKSQFVGQIFVSGDPSKTCVMAVVVPDEAYLEKWSPSNGMPTSLEEFCKNPRSKEIILEDMKAQGVHANLLGFERVKDIHLEHQPFTVENGMLTPTMKNKRFELRCHYENIIEALYKSNEL